MNKHIVVKVLILFLKEVVDIDLLLILITSFFFNNLWKF
nr:MAG TPA: hypothetical protein [Crassvirales sp.]